MLRSCTFSLALAPVLAMAQMELAPGTALHVAGGTSVRIDGVVTFTLPAGSTLVNDGSIAFGPQAELSEALGAPITGAGTESTARLYPAPLLNTDAAGLGFSLTTAAAPDSLIVVRGHLPRINNLNAQSIARWFHVRSGNATGLAPTAVLRYDPNELNGIPELALRMARNTDGFAWWPELASTIDPGLHTATAAVPDSLGWFTLFDDALISTVHDGAMIHDLTLFPTCATEFVTVAGQQQIERVEVIDATGRIVWQAQPEGDRSIHIPVQQCSSGAYLVRVNGIHTLRFVKP